MNFTCSLCGSRHWPTENTNCPLCYEAPEVDYEADEEPEGREPFEDDFDEPE